MNRLLISLTAVLVAVSLLSAAPAQDQPAAKPAAEKAAAPAPTPAADKPADPASWKNGPSTDPSFFPLGVWAQAPKHAAQYKEMGINFYLSLAGGPTEEQLAELKKAGMKTICSQNEVGLKHLDDPTIIGWMHGDEPDNFKKDENGKWVPKQKPDSIIADYQKIKAADPTRPVLLNLGQGVANIGYKGGWAKDADYAELVKGCDIVSYVIYPACSDRAEVAGKLELCAAGVDRLRKLSEDKKIVWFITEASAIRNKERVVTAAEMRFEVWSAIIHGAKGIIYFCHQWEPKKDFAFPLNDPAMKAAVTATNKEILGLARVLNTPTLEGRAKATCDKAEAQVDVMVKRLGDATYVFAANMRNVETAATIEVSKVVVKEAQVLSENRKLPVAEGKLTDTFKPYSVHIYCFGDPDAL